MENLKDYSFTDCIVVDFSVDKYCSIIKIVVESYFPERTVSLVRKKGLLEISLTNISKIALSKNFEFEVDLDKPYDSMGNDLKSNEVYSITYDLNEGVFEFSMESDMLDLLVTCQGLNIAQVLS